MAEGTQAIEVQYCPVACKAAGVDAGLGSSFHLDLGQIPLTAKKSLFLLPWL